MKNILITGGAGFIGSHLVRLMVNKYPEYRIINLDKLTYAGNLANLKDIEKKPNYVFEKADICDFPFNGKALIRAHALIHAFKTAFQKIFHDFPSCLGSVSPCVFM